MADILPLFSTHYGLNGESLLTLEEPGKAKAGAPLSVFDLAKEGDLKEVVVCDSRIDGFIAAYKAATKAKVKLCFGLKLTICADMVLKDDASLRTESKVIVFARNGEPDANGNPKGYADLVRIWSRAATEGFYYTPRLDWTTLRALWTDNLTLALPFFSSFIARNTLTFGAVVPDLPTAAHTVFREVGSDLPFARLIEGAVERYAAATPGATVVQSKAIYYPSRAHFRPYVVMRALANRASWVKPKVDHLSSPEFCWEAFKELTQAPNPATIAS